MSRHGTHWRKAEDHGDEPDSTPIGEHTHRQPRIVLMGLTAMVVLLLLSNGLTLVYGVSVNSRLTQLEEFVAGRGVQRDAENQRLNDRLDQAVCDVLDSLPAGALLDPTRTQYGCGPGIPAAELDPAALENLAELLEQSNAQTLPAPTGDSDQPGPSSEPGDLPPGAPPGAEPSPMGQAPATTAPVPTTAPTPTTGAATATTGPPLVDLSTVTDQVCAALGVCL